ncbi:MAG: hypothetical protein JKY22_07815, partial [Flavobacteriaceae bacterium]|nr:hypothetical protein [Flavobacteriaceae bacterium]
MKKLILAILVVLPVLVHGQTTTENYIKTTSFQVSTDINNQSNVSDYQKIEAITYFDGLGRPKQSITERLGGNQEDHITPVEYDPYGRQTKQWLPFVVNSNNGSYYEGSGGLSLQQETKNYYKTKFYDDFYQGAGNHPDWDNPFSETRFEDSPLNRVLEQGTPGFGWKLNYGGEHTIKHEYQVNNSDNVFKFKVNFINGDTSEPELIFNGWFPNESLFKTITKDENWQASDGSNNTVEEFTNKTGQIILKRSFNNGNRHNTYYAYDDFGNLTYVLSPECSENVRDNNNNNTIIQSVLDDFGYQYTYDHRNRLIEKKLPGKEIEYILYDALDRPTLTQDANLRNDNNKWLFTKYDNYNRVVYTGIYTPPPSTPNNQIESNLLASQYISELRATTATNIGGTFVYYTNSVFPSESIEILTVNYYDQYIDTAGLSVPSTIYGVATATGTELQGLPTVAKIKVLETSNWSTSITGYDKKGRGLYSASFNSYLNTNDIVFSNLDFAGKVIETTTIHDKDTNPTITIMDYFTYDHMGRLITHEQKMDNEQVQLITENFYDELGQLIRKNVGGETILDGYTDLINVDVTFEGTIEKTGTINSWNARVKTKGEIVQGTNGGVSCKIVTANKAIKIGLYKSSPLLVPFDYLHNGILATGIPASGGGYQIKYIVNGTEYTSSAKYYTGSILKVELINNGTEIAYSVGNNVFHNITSVTPQTT